MTEKLTPSAVRTGFEKKAQQMRTGLQQHLPPNTTLVVKGVAYTQGQLVQAMKEAERLYVAVRDARTALRQALLDRQAKVLPLAELHADLAMSLRGYFGRSSVKLADLGVRHGARPARSVRAQTLAQAKARLTRAARHTMGRKQRLAVRAPGTPSLIVFDPQGKPIAAAGPAASIKTPPDHGPGG
jgi:hypothetical protein